MTQNKRFKCELCHRDFSMLDCHKLVQQNYVAYICPTCSLITTNEFQKERLMNTTLQMPKQNLNIEMQQVHNTISNFITLGSIFLITSLATLYIANLEGVIPTIYSMIKHSIFSMN